MTTQARALITPELDLQAFASRATARSSHAFTLAELANDAAGGHLAQRWTLSRIETTTRHWFFESDSSARFLTVRAAISRKGATWVLGDGVVFTLTITDGTNTANTLAEGIPDGLRGDRLPIGPAPSAHYEGRLQSLGVTQWTLDLDTLAATLTASTLWRFTLAVVVDATTYLESFQIEQAARLLVDTADSYGVLPHSFLPRGVVRDGDSGLQRIGATLEAAYDKSLRTYHAMSRDEATPWTTTSASYATMGNDTEPGGAARAWVVRPRRMKSAGGQCRVRFVVRYKSTDNGAVRLTTGVSTYAVALASSAGAWADAAVTTAYLDTSAGDYLDALQWHAKVDSGTLSVSARVVFDYPA